MAQTGTAVTSSTTIFKVSTQLYNAWDLGATLGGYIIKDKLWFFVGFDPSQYTSQLTRTVSPFATDASGNIMTDVNGVPQHSNLQYPGATRNYYGTQTNFQYIGKLTYLINSDNRVSLSIAGTPDSYTSPYIFGPNGDYGASGYAGNDNTIDMVLRLNSSFLE
ncbi:MAG: hypothetical protein ACLQDQ_07505, partial [Myxococcaceae bacterium]